MQGVDALQCEPNITTGWWLSVVVNALASINIVNLHFWSD